MKKYKLIAICLLAVVVLAVGIFVLPMDAEAATYSGTCGINLTWTLDDSGTLTISGIGAMADYASGTAPWYSQRESIKTVVIENGVTTIGNEAFNNYTSLTNVTVGNSVTTIGNSAFSECTSLTDVIMGNGVTAIGTYAFFHTAITSITIPAGVTTLSESAFNWCLELAGIWVDENNPNYSSDERGVLFDKNKTTVIEAPCKLTGYYDIPVGVTVICDGAFDACNKLTSITIPEGVVEIGSATFGFCTGLTSVTIPDGVTTIGKQAFTFCSGLISVTIPVSVTAIGNGAFSLCSSLTDVYYGGTQSQWEAISVDKNNSNLTDATIHYLHTHDYTEDPTTCGICGNVRATLGITTVTLRPSCAGIYFKGAFTFDEEVAVARYGIAVSVYNKLPEADDSDEESLYTIGTKSALITEILTSGNANLNAKKPVYARAYALLEDGTMIYGDAVAVSLKSLVEAVDSTAYVNLNATQKDALNEMYQQFSAVMENWNIPNIKEYGQA